MIDIFKKKLQFQNPDFCTKPFVASWKISKAKNWTRFPQTALKLQKAFSTWTRLTKKWVKLFDKRIEISVQLLLLLINSTLNNSLLIYIFVTCFQENSYITFRVNLNSLRDFLSIQFFFQFIFSCIVDKTSKLEKQHVLQQFRFLEEKVQQKLQKNFDIMKPI